MDPEVFSRGRKRTGVREDLRIIIFDMASHQQRRATCPIGLPKLRRGGGNPLDLGVKRLVPSIYLG
jgi:hypothetical protein